MSDTEEIRKKLVDLRSKIQKTQESIERVRATMQPGKGSGNSAPRKKARAKKG